MSINFNIAAINQCTEAEGPNKRLAIWFQGCNIQCAECCNPKLFSLNKANIVSLDELIDIIKNAKFNIPYITIDGNSDPDTITKDIIQHLKELKKLP